MLNAIIQFSIRNKGVVLLATGALIVWGLWSATQLPIDAVPDITNNQVQVITTCPTLASQEVEQFVTYPIEQAVANLPDIRELRSISRFGLSVVTIVFEENVDIWFARQLVGEKLLEANEDIPQEIGKPELAPVSTGLGEIYQYVLHPKPGSEDKYSSMDLRTMQDWIVARQLYGTPGVAEVNSFGGLVKQYEVAVNPDRLRAMDVSIAEIFSALQNNNENTGGAYIEKKPNAYFIRGIGLVKNLEDIRHIVIKSRSSGIPVLIGDVATVRFGNAIRYGALTFNGEKEAVGGMVMMLKGANSAAVVERVRQKMDVIRKSLPDDIIIEPFLDRTNLVHRAMRTVEKNLLEGALIVIFILVVFLGNLRSGLVVASAIPLSMLFALGMMHVFGVSANLMSLGALDFGLIVDGAVIIVEATMHAIGVRRQTYGPHKLTQAEMDEVVGGSAKRMMNSATFGQCIILIVYLPVLALTGIEGKMFGPMAQTVSFAILGAILLSLTYIPVASALVLPKRALKAHNLSDRFIAFLQRLYTPVIRAAVRMKYLVIAGAVFLLMLSGWIFSRLGSEFIPQLQEGDYAFHCILPMGASLSQSIETSMQAERLLMTFPEVKMVVGKTGSAEVPTDPMPPEATDMMIILKDKSEWTTTDDYNALAHLMLEKLSTIPGIFFESNQPIQMRFNELMTGIRQDVAVKIFGDNVDTLAALAPVVSRIIRETDGTSAPQIEQTTGLPQITIEYDRSRLANYGINVEEVNHAISTAFAGEKAGVVFEDERRFDLVVRLDSAYRTSFDDVSELLIPTSTGGQIPVSQVARVAFRQGPAQISRDDGRRRIVVGFNVAGRDVGSVVEEIREKLGASLKLPTGYYYTFGGTFENLEEALSRLKIAVPAALLLIFILLHFTFRSTGQALLVFSAIPMSAIGGIFALYLRDMPFSISAGVGFIALFGVSVLNGIVLIATFNELKNEGMDDAFGRVIEGTRSRLRPVLMTAAVASLGFLPMALSQSAGAEVQKPLATVVIGGLLTSTFLTLVLLPILYLIFQKPLRITRRAYFLIPALLITTLLCAQAPRITLEEAIGIGEAQNMQLELDRLEVRHAELQASGIPEFGRTGVFIENEDFSPDDPDGLWKIGLSQSFSLPGVYKARASMLKGKAALIGIQESISRRQIGSAISEAYYTTWYYTSVHTLLLQLDSMYTRLADAANVRVRAGESAALEGIAAEARQQEIRIQIRQNEADIRSAQLALRKAMQTESAYLPAETFLEKYPLPDDTLSTGEHPLMQKLDRAISLARADITYQQKARLPDFSTRFFSQRLYGVSPPVSGFSFTVGIPLIGSVGRNKIEAAKVSLLAEQTRYNMEKQHLQIETARAREAVEKADIALSYYEQEGTAQADAIASSATLAFETGDISYADLSQYLTQAIAIRQHYLDALHAYNMAAIQYQYYVRQ